MPNAVFWAALAIVLWISIVKVPPMQLDTSTELIQLLWQYSSEILASDYAYSEACFITQKLIDWYGDMGLLPEQYVSEVSQRCLPLHPTASEGLTGKRILVTGATGCIGNRLIQELIKHRPASIVTLGRQPFANVVRLDNGSTSIQHITADIRDGSAITAIVSRTQPEIVFHLAAERNPARAERTEVWTATTNILGTYNLLQSCERCPSVEQFIFSSTGKCSRYYTEEFYAATKKVCEWLLYQTAMRQERMRIAFVRFTHVIDNSLWIRDLQTMMRDQGVIALHGPERYITAQSALESAQLLINTLSFARSGVCKFLVVRHLSWPATTLQIALSAIRDYHQRTGQLLPIQFTGPPRGYAEKFFRGQTDWHSPKTAHLLLNAYESDRGIVDGLESLLISEAGWVPEVPLQVLIQQLQQPLDRVSIRYELNQCLQTCVQAAIAQADPQRTLRILLTGLDPRYLELDRTQPADFRWIVTAMITATVQAVDRQELHLPPAAASRLLSVAAELGLLSVVQQLEARTCTAAS